MAQTVLSFVVEVAPRSAERLVGLIGALASFSEPFRQGMQQIDRRRRLGDDGTSAIDGGPIWSGGGDTRVAVHAVLLLYARDDAALDAECETARGVLAGAGVEIRRRVRLTLRLDEHGISREHFDFADGISQPLPFGPESRTSGGAAAPRDPWHGVAVGDVLMGYPDGPRRTGRRAAGKRASRVPQPGREWRLPGRPRAAPGRGAVLDLDGRRRDRRRRSGPGRRRPRRKAIGRGVDGAPLAPVGPGSPAAGQPANAFGYFQGDPHGFSCPLGSHVRRANPRDGLARDAAGAPAMLEFSNHHRILRRGRKFGPDIANPRIDDGVGRGLLFMCLVTDLARQFEFVQQNWLLNPPFATLFDETDPMLGPLGPFALPGRPLRRRVAVETFVRFAGGEYFFLPSLPALDYLEGLG